MKQQCVIKHMDNTKQCVIYVSSVHADISLFFLTPFSASSLLDCSRYCAASYQISGWWPNTKRHCSYANITRRRHRDNAYLAFCKTNNYLFKAQCFSKVLINQSCTVWLKNDILLPFTKFVNLRAFSQMYLLFCIFTVVFLKHLKLLVTQEIS